MCKHTRERKKLIGGQHCLGGAAGHNKWSERGIVRDVADNNDCADKTFSASFTKLWIRLLATADDERKTLMIQMAAYYRNARVAVNKTHNNCVAATPETPAVPKHVVMDTPSMQNVAAAAAKPLDDVNDATCSHGDAIDKPGEARSLLMQQATSDINIRLYQYQRELQTIWSRYSYQSWTRVRSMVASGPVESGRVRLDNCCNMLR